LSTPHPPALRDKFLARLSGMFGGAFSVESWTLSQSYYFGSVARNPSHRAEVIDGACLDLLDALDATAIGRPKERGVGRQPQPKADPYTICEARISGIVRTLLDNIRRATDGAKHVTLRDNCLTLGGYLAQIGWSVEEAAEQAVAALPASVDDWGQARETALWAISRGMEQPLELEDRPYQQARLKPNGAYHAEPPRPDDYASAQPESGVEADEDDATSSQPPPAAGSASGLQPHSVGAAFFDPWADPSPPEFPGGILTREVEDVVFALALRDGICSGALAMGYLTAVSGAAMKGSRFLPYQNSAWWVPPIVWTLLIADSGQRKTAVEAIAFAALRQLDADLWGPFAAALSRWKALPSKERTATPKPPEPHTFLAEDTTPEQLQIILSNTTRGTFLKKDEVAGFFDFARYQGTNKNAGAASRAFYLQAYEAGPYTVSRVTRDSLHIENNALTIFGSIQPDRLTDFPDLAKDGLLQRINTIRASPAAGSRDNITVKHHDLLDARITGLAKDDIAQVYRTTQDGSALIRQTEADGQAMASIGDYGQGFQGTCSKLHGTHARYALVLHLLDSTGSTLIPTDTVERARRLVREFLLPQAGSFFANLAGSPYQRMREAAGWILTKAATRFVASDLTAGVRGCRGMRTKDIGEMLDPLVSGGWLEPENPFPTNRAWEVHPMLRSALAERVKAEAERRARVRELWKMVGTKGYDVLHDLPA
jgi:hypothetical protein